jgi:hypothetical protein
VNKPTKKTYIQEVQDSLRKAQQQAQSNQRKMIAQLQGNISNYAPYMQKGLSLLNQAPSDYGTQLMGRARSAIASQYDPSDYLASVGQSLGFAGAGSGQAAQGAMDYRRLHLMDPMAQAFENVSLDEARRQQQERLANIQAAAGLYGQGAGYRQQYADVLGQMKYLPMPYIPNYGTAQAVNRRLMFPY